MNCNEQDMSTKVKIENEDVIEWCKKYRGEKFMALLCDAPYSLGDGKKGFMNKEWDNEIACNPDTWRALAEHLLSGAFLFVFAGTLNDDLISVAMRQAGLRKFHKAINWAFGSGFPKSSKIDTKIDKASGVDRKIIGKNKNYRSGRKNCTTYQRLNDSVEPEYITAPITPLAKIWAGHRYGLQAIKPAAETILIFQKPYDGKPVDSIVKNGSGALNVDGARIGIKDGGWNGLGDTHNEANWRLNNPDGIQRIEGRWPANLILQHSSDCNGVCSPECVVRVMDEQSGISKSSGGISIGRRGWILAEGSNDRAKSAHAGGIGDTGGASRFFFNADWNYEVEEQIANADAVRYQAKAGRRERDAGLDSMSGKVLHTTMSGAHINKPDYKTSDGAKRTGIRQPQQNLHPTVKPLSLCKYLATLLLPPSEYSPRRILIPFAGVMSEANGAMLAGWDEIVAIEKEKEYCEIGKARVKYWQNHKEPSANKSKPPEKTVQKTDGALELFPELA